MTNNREFGIIEAHNKIGNNTYKLRKRMINETNMYEAGIRFGDRLDLIDFLSPNLPTGIYALVVTPTKVMVEGFDQPMSLTAACEAVFKEIFPERYAQRDTWSFRGPQYWILTRGNVSVKDLVAMQSLQNKAN